MSQRVGLGIIFFVYLLFIIIFYCFTIELPLGLVTTEILRSFVFFFFPFVKL